MVSTELLDQRKEAAAQMLATGGIGITAISDKIGVSRTALYNWRQDEIFAARVADLKHEFKSFGINLIESKLVDAINEYWDIIHQTEDSRVKAEGYRYDVRIVLRTHFSYTKINERMCPLWETAIRPINLTMTSGK